MENKTYGSDKVNDMSNPKNWDIWPAPKNHEAVYQFFPEFTCLCPRSGYPDFAKIHIITVPGQKVVELKCLKLWLNSFRDVGISHENMTQKVAKTLYDELGLEYIWVLMEYSPRGNLTTFPMTTMDRGLEKNGVGAGYEFGIEIDTIKTKILNKVI